MNKILIATHNRAKLTELKFGAKILEKKGITIVSLDDLHIDTEPEETGHTFTENAVIKAKYYNQFSGLPTIADDGGLEIEILNGEPGVKSKRWVGHEGTDEELITYTLKRLAGLPKEKRAAYLTVCLCFFDQKTKINICEQEKIYGHIAEVPSGRPTHGYPFRALFIVDEFNKYYDELTPEEHNKINHRLKALKRLVSKIEDNLIK